VKFVGLILIFVAALAGFLITSAPLSAALDMMQVHQRGLIYSDASGTIWRGVVRDVSVAGQRVGDVEISVARAALLRGEGAVTFSSRGSVRADGVLRIRLGGVVRLERATFVVDARDLTRLHPDIAARGGEVFVRVEEAVFNHQKECMRASGAVQTDVLARGADAARWRGPVLEGDISCADGALMIALSGAESGVDVRVTAQLSARDGARLVADVSTQEPTLAAPLLYFGFEENSEGFTYAYESAGGGAS